MRLPSFAIDAVALYGSQLRSDFDRMSDRDILLVGASINDLYIAKEHFSKEGYSCAVYTWDRIRNMSDKGSLFIQHLKQEALIIIDNNDKLKSILEDFCPKNSYTTDIEATKNIVALTEHISHNKVSIGWAFDILAVAVRNIAILTLANTGQYIFGYSDLLKKLSKMGKVDGETCWRLNHLREWKHKYRIHRYDSMPKAATLQSLQLLIGSTFDIDFDSKILSSDDLINSLESRSDKIADHYGRFRLLEGAINIQLHRSLGSMFNIRQRFHRIVMNQNLYGLFFHDLSRPMRDLSIELNLEERCQQIAALDKFSAALQICQ